MRTLVSIITLAMAISTVAQESVTDSLRGVWTDDEIALDQRFEAMEMFYQRFGNTVPQEVLELSDYHYQLASDSSSNDEKFVALNNRARAYYVKSLLDSSLSVLKQAAILAGSIDDQRTQITLLGNIGSILREDDRPKEAMENYLKCGEILKGLEYPLIQADLFCNISLLYFDIRERKLAYQYADSARAYFEKAEVPEERRNVWHIMASIQLDWGQTDSALFFCRKSIRSFVKQQNTFFLGDAYYMMANIHNDRGSIDSALFYLEESLEVEKTIGNSEKIARGQVLKAKILLPIEPDKALALRDSIKASLPVITTNLMKVGAYETLYDLAKEGGLSEEALAMNELILAYKDSLQSEEQRLAVIRQSMNKAFSAELEKEQQARIDEREELEQEQLFRTSTLMAIGISTLGLLLFLMYRRRRVQEQETKKLVEEINALKEKANGPGSNDRNNSVYLEGFRLDRENIQRAIDRELNETDWKVLELLAQDPVMSNKELAEKAFRSVDGIGSSLRRMYVYFEIKESKYKKISLILEAIKISGRNPLKVSS